MRLIVNKNIVVLLIVLATKLLALPTICRSQTGTIKVSGGVVQLIASSISHYNNGVYLTNWSKVKINYTFVGVLNWQLRIKASDPNILSDDGNPDLPLNSIKLTPINIVNTSTTYTVNPAYTLTNAGQVFISGTGTNDFELTFGITYELGTVTPLLNTKNGYYYTNLEFILEYF